MGGEDQVQHFNLVFQITLKKWENKTKKMAFGFMRSVKLFIACNRTTEFELQFFRGGEGGRVCEKYDKDKILVHVVDSFLRASHTRYNCQILLNIIIFLKS